MGGYLGVYLVFHVSLDFCFEVEPHHGAPGGLELAIRASLDGHVW